MDRAAEWRAKRMLGPIAAVSAKELAAQRAEAMEQLNRALMRLSSAGMDCQLIIAFNAFLQSRVSVTLTDVTNEETSMDVQLTDSQKGLLELRDKEGNIADVQDVQWGSVSGNAVVVTSPSPDGETRRLTIAATGSLGACSITANFNRKNADGSLTAETQQVNITVVSGDASQVALTNVVEIDSDEVASNQSAAVSPTAPTIGAVAPSTQTVSTESQGKVPVATAQTQALPTDSQPASQALPADPVTADTNPQPAADAGQAPFQAAPPAAQQTVFTTAQAAPADPAPPASSVDQTPSV